MNKIFIYAIILVLITLVIIYTSRENSIYEPYKGCVGVDSANKCKKNFLSYSFVVPFDYEAKAASVPAKQPFTGHVFGATASGQGTAPAAKFAKGGFFGATASGQGTAPAAKFAKGGFFGASASAASAAPTVGLNKVEMNLCCDTIENLHNARREIKLMEIDNKVNLLEHLLPPYVKTKIQTSVSINAPGPKSYNLQPRLAKLENHRVMDGNAIIQMGKKIERMDSFLDKAAARDALAPEIRDPRAIASAGKSNSFFSFLGF